MLLKIFVLQLAIFGSSCKETSLMKGGDTVKCVEKKVFSYSMDSSNINHFGFKTYETGEILSVNCMLVYDEFTYLSDPVQGRVKKIDNNNGKIVETSQVLFSDNKIITALSFFNDLLYAITYDGNIVILDKKLEIVKNINIPEYVGDKIIFEQPKNETLIIYRSPVDVFQDTVHNVYIKRLLINTDGLLKNDTIKIGKGYNTYTSFKSNTINGKTITEKKLEGNNMQFVFDNTLFQIDEKVPTIKYYENQNSDFTRDYFVYFDVNAEKLNLYICKLSSD